MPEKYPDSCRRNPSSEHLPKSPPKSRKPEKYYCSVKPDPLCNSTNFTDHTQEFCSSSHTPIISNEKVSNLEIDMLSNDSNSKSIFTINTPNFSDSVKNCFKFVLNSIKITDFQKSILMNKSNDLLNEFVSRADNNEFTVRKNVNIRTVAGGIIYTVLVSERNMPEIGSEGLATVLKISNTFSRFYNRYFKEHYPRIRNRFFIPHNFIPIRNSLSLFLFDQLNSKQYDQSTIISETLINAENILSREKYDVFSKISRTEGLKRFLFDLVKVINTLIIVCPIHLEIRAQISIKPLAEYLYSQGICLEKRFKGFYRSVLEVYDILKENHPTFFPDIMYSNSSASEREILDNKIVVRNRLKYYIIKRLYNGLYYKNGKLVCHDCLKVGLFDENYPLRLHSIEFHHPKFKDMLYRATDLWKLFNKFRGDPFAIDKVIRLMESERIVLLCRVHHQLRHSKNYNRFKHLINQDFSSFTAEDVYILVKHCVNSFFYCSPKSNKQKGQIIYRIIEAIKKKTIIDTYYNGSCPICEIFNTREHLTAFTFHHLSDHKSINASSLYHLPINEIIGKLIEERGGYICKNCHTVLHYDFMNLINEIFDDPYIVQEIRTDYDQSATNFTNILMKGVVRVDLSLDKTINVTDMLIDMLLAVYNLSKRYGHATPKSLSEYLEVHVSSIHSFFSEKIIRGESDLERYFIITRNIPPHPNTFTLTEMGSNLVTLMHQLS